MRPLAVAGLTSVTLLLLATSISSQQADTPWRPERPVTFADLTYPKEALAAGVMGRVVVRITTNAKGEVVEVDALAGPEELIPAAVANAKRWVFRQPVRAGVIVYRLRIDPADCQDDSHSLFRLVHANLVVVTACSRVGRQPVSSYPPSFETPQWEIQSFGKRPPYPPIAGAARMTGVVVLEFSLDDRGSVAVRSLTDIPLLADAAVAHAKQWRVQPTERRRNIVVYEFTLDNQACDAESATAFWTVTTGYVRLSGCGPIVQVAKQ
jgi:outer membrane biosynthesis protein TonB